jgi:hypothetical protein
MLNILLKWVESKKKILALENFDIEVSPILGEDKKARYIDLFNSKIAARVTVWETGEADFEAIDSETSRDVLNKSMIIEEWQIEDRLNWWLSEIIVYPGTEGKI